MLSCKFCEISKNTFYRTPLDDCFFLLLDVFFSILWNLVEYKLLFPVAIICCILTNRSYISYDFHEVLLIKLSIVKYNYGYCKKFCWCVIYYLVWNIFCEILLTKMNVDEY